MILRVFTWRHGLRVLFVATALVVLAAVLTRHRPSADDWRRRPPAARPQTPSPSGYRGWVGPALWGLGLYGAWFLWLRVRWRRETDLPEVRARIIQLEEYRGFLDRINSGQWRGRGKGNGGTGAGGW